MVSFLTNGAILLLATAVTRTVSFSVSSSTAAISPLSTVPSNSDSAELLQLLQQKSSGEPASTERINYLVNSLCNSKCTFDPATSIDGPLFATCHFIGKTPLWEKVGAAQSQNKKGQKYTLGKDGEQNRVVNYSEILGNAINLQAKGTFVEGDSNKDRASGSSSSPVDTVLKSLFSKKGSSNALKTCPYDYSVTVTGASINVFGTSIQIPIKGLGVSRVLYADPCLRIFISPNDTQVTSGGGDWETAGLVTVQVRIDLIDPTWNDDLL